MKASRPAIPFIDLKVIARNEPHLPQESDLRKNQSTKRANSKDMDIDIVALSLTPDLSRTAFLLDIDGTIVDIALTPRDVRVPDSLRHALARLIARTNGAVALVSGRSLEDIDRLFSPMRLTAVGGHGAEFQLIDGSTLEWRDPPPLDAELRRPLVALAARRGLAAG